MSVNVYENGELKNIGGGGSGGINYSTNEQLTGDTWIDGRPIYRKAFNEVVSQYTDAANRRVFSLQVLSVQCEIINTKGYVVILENVTYPQSIGVTFSVGSGPLPVGENLDVGYDFASSSSSSTGTTVYLAVNKLANYGVSTSIRITGAIEYVK